MKNAKCKLCRREGIKLFLKGERCYSTKCALVKRKYPPGVHGPKGYLKLTEYGQQLREKQKLKRNYNISERQLKNYFNKAKRKIGNTEIDLMKMLEMRLDSVVFNVGFATSRLTVRQMINHGHILVNGRKVTIPSYQVKVGDVISLKQNSKLKKNVEESLIFCAERRKMHLDWLAFDEKKLEIKVVSQPEVDNLLKEFNIKLVVEFYSR
ncbi:MAG: 30S ribosomal protein S4 [Patescibacteria group bacterium]